MIYMCLISILVIIVLARPLLRRETSSDGATPDSAVIEYQRRMADLKQDETRGAITSQEAEHARAEMGRQLLREKKEHTKHIATAPAHNPAQTDSKWGRMIVLLVIALLPVAAGTLYWHLGNPGVTDQPFAARDRNEPQQNQPRTPPTRSANSGGQDTPSEKQIRQFIDQLELRLAANPDDPQGWTMLARTYQGIEDPVNAARAWQGLLTADPENGDALWFLGVHAAKSNHASEARELWTKLQKRYDLDSDDYKLIEEALATLNQ